MSANADVIEYVLAPQCPIGCPFIVHAPVHHDQLLMVDHDIDQAVSLIELAVTWGELDYSQARLIAPAQWLEFAARHRWKYPCRAETLFSLAVDAALHSVAGSRRRVV
jgi:hypothetical protein